ncbi:hypothetical protein [Enorma phocaeensis]|uniref:Thioredoxin-like fold domain-containing protein n=1 Tax=Enorma phocaeensis TaxID=1871019 RepID=A0A921IV57_9ACTN|nr:hypothetical protein [Enorma phocaeensis]HJG36674.1 hypothetical protein [Enorma phocaeensis]
MFAADNKRDRLELTLAKVNKALLAMLIGVACIVGAMLAMLGAVTDDFESSAGGAAGNSTASAETQHEPMQSDFVYVEEPYDINPGRPYVVYTNFACPHCAELFFGARERGVQYTSRILLLEDAEGVFATQRVVSAYMLKLYREDSAVYDVLEEELFDKQAEWTLLDDAGVLGWLNERSGQRWAQEDLASDLEEVERIEDEAPEDLEYVPGVFQDGLRCDDVMYDLLAEGAAVIAAREEG